MSNLIRKLVRGFNRKHSISQQFSNEACLPQPHKISTSYILLIYLSYLGVWLLLFGQAYIQRTRRVIAAYYYRKREKRRVLYLYNETLRRRKSFLRWARSRAYQSARSRLLAPGAHFWINLRENRPKIWKWLRKFGLAGLDCVVCGEPEPFNAKKNQRHHLCRGVDCLASYCDECWRDLGRSCWSVGCAPDNEDDDDEDDDHDYHNHDDDDYYKENAD